MDIECSYFCSYLTSRNSAVSGYGDFIFTGKVRSPDDLLGDIKKEIQEAYYSNEPSIQIVITALNKL